MKNPRTEGVPAEVLQVHGNDVYQLKLEDGREVKAYKSGRMKINRVTVMVGDKVRVVLDPHGGTATNRIVYRV